MTQTATILGTLIEKVGLRVPTSFVYKKFSIPEPEEGEEIAKPTYGGGMGGVLPFKRATRCSPSRREPTHRSARSSTSTGSPPQRSARARAASSVRSSRFSK